MIYHDPIQSEERAFDRSLRPASFAEFIGQDQLRENLEIAITAARKRDEPLDHILFVGPPGLGKTTLSHLIAQGMDTAIVVTSGPALGAPRDLMGTLTRLEWGDVLFVDEIHRMPQVVEEYLYAAMEDHAIDVVLDPGPTGRSVRLTVQPFTLVGATTREGMLTAAFRSRFGLIERLATYPPEDVRTIIERAAVLLQAPITADAAAFLADRSRGVPRMALRLLRRVRDLAQFQNRPTIDAEVSRLTMERLGIDHLGLEDMDRRILSALVDRGEAVGLKTLAAMMEESEETLEDVFEPHLIRSGLLVRTSRGRMATPQAYRHLGLSPDGEASPLPFSG